MSLAADGRLEGSAHAVVEVNIKQRKICEF